jgi:hypothetical protein
MRISYLVAISLVLPILVLSGCTSGIGSTGYEKEVQCPSITVKEGLEIEKNEFDDSGNLYILHNTFEYINFPSEWKVDDDKMIGTALSCKKGTKEGQNASYWYCAPFFLEKLTTNDAGEIVAKEKLSVAPIFKKEAGLVKIVSFTCYAPED